MSEAIKRRRGTTVEHSTFTGLEGEITVDITKKTAVVHDGVTPGGFPLARADQAGPYLTVADYLMGAIGLPETILTVGEAGADDENIREIGNYIYDPEDEVAPHKLTYSGNKVPYAQDQVWVFWASSLDGKTWTKRGKLVSRPSEDPYVVRHNGTYYLYVEDKQPIPFTGIRLFTSTDFVSWTDRGLVLDKGVSGWDSQDVSSPTVIVDDGTWYMLFEGRFGGGIDQIGLATSNDGINWTKHASNPVVGAKQCWLWSEGHVPDDIRKVGSEFVMISHPKIKRAASTPRWVSGIALSKDLINWRDPIGHPVSLPSPADRATVMFFERDGELLLLCEDRTVGLQVLRPLGLSTNYSEAAGNNSGLSLGTSTYTTVPLDTVVQDSQQGWDLENDCFVVQRSGLYDIDLWCDVTSNVGGGRVGCRLLINEGEFINGQVLWIDSPSVRATQVMGSFKAYLFAGDQLRIQAYAQLGNTGEVRGRMSVLQVH
ncbi:hypothetical protein REJC140_00096 [Pseudorhizobium endolithicum]|uniref:Major tropism determinant N-terminal domain-containing protein n=1 Tax=Pseudorhizobium endolithicum TaxID=1191678 RepID=A0ABN7JGW3_9HYPH|nr:family 43 glycosylhydrolase [Pseudorhizobium endolithicum]CAD7023109.1 hypothetical protein REJC140_00096 [Pseudorhizobium endolithicum]